ncbi:carbohydrate kinase family protein [Vreelandella malpeensis]|uniref:Carbohydrate kinase n=1 Tax=Vreelandella malpeensis TaxID=1172368 RepID=A0ABS8DV45_9GAMM|nr:carbohydrate kinase [Halomonas malpeensis]MCB8890207.1 carbohydrate kinase [Halomonas malpeensis]
MLPIVAFGEALVDMLSSRLGEQAGTETFTPYAGGAPANVAVACARLGVPSRFLGMLGDDGFGRFIEAELARHGVDTRGVVFTRQARTALAFVSRDATGERTFDFYRPPAADLLYREEHLPVDAFERPVILHLCSNSLTEADIFATTLAIARRGADAGALISVDANLRHNLWAQGEASIERVTALLDTATMIKVSREELDYLRGPLNPQAWMAKRLAAGARVILVTDGPSEVRLKTATLDQGITPPRVRAVDTTAGGDAFMGGFLASISRRCAAYERPLEALDGSEALIEAVDIACRCGAFAVTRPGAYAALPTRQDIDALA